MGYSSGIPTRVRLYLNQLSRLFKALHSVVLGVLAPSVCKHVRDLAFSHMSVSDGNFSSSERSRRKSRF